ncbi:uncharacterized protein DSM5745_07583 [Aspergillus mulundensis]|uniref:DUF7770 domain-containing protein n=1 Tax=Aspergillus mulundensis TaxID=1810919 RepID=A0A3D8REY3_9EURO|nr:Uncharacterized protein DSM5745_07583 [Aspergillus mulundensis]RDW72411.1 Uncharacterized protein DSM5745_07583 [Aspergillus mulundensis]
MNFTAPIFQPIQFVPASKKPEILELPVLHISAVAHARLESGGNHWTFYMTVSSTESIQVDMTPSYTVPSTITSGGSKGNLVVSQLTYKFSPDSTKIVRLDVRDGLTVKHFVELLESEKRHLFEFNELGQGCRFWVDDQLTLFSEKGLLTNQNQVEEARASILTQYPDEKQYPLVVGSYYG